MNQPPYFSWSNNCNCWQKVFPTLLKNSCTYIKLHHHFWGEAPWCRQSPCRFIYCTNPQTSKPRETIRIDSKTFTPQTCRVDILPNDVIFEAEDAFSKPSFLVQYNSIRKMSWVLETLAVYGVERETCIEMNRIIAYYTGILCVGGKFPESLALLMGNDKLTLAPPENAWDLWNSMNNIAFSIHNCLTRFVSMNSISNDSLGCSQLLSHTFPYRSPKLPPFQSPAETNATNFGMEFSFCQGRSRLRKLGFDKDLGFCKCHVF